MNEKKTAPYGSWKSPLSASMITKKSIGVGTVRLEGDDIYWKELLPSEGGRLTVVRRTPHGEKTRLVPQPFNVRTRVHEYGGRDYAIHDGVLYFSNFADQRIYKVDIESAMAGDAEPQPITPEENIRYADHTVDTTRNRFLLVQEDHTGEGEAVNTLVSMKLDGSDKLTLAEGNDFYSTPTLSPDGKKLAYLTWNHPNMPWDGTELFLGDLNDDGDLENQKQIAAGTSISIFQPLWSPGGTLYFASDHTGWWNLYRYDGGDVKPVYPMKAEFGDPQWVFGTSTYGFTDDKTIIARYQQNGLSHLGRIDLESGSLSTIDTPYQAISGVAVDRERVVFLGGSPMEATSVVLVDLGSGDTEVLRRSTAVQVEEGYISKPEPIEFPTEGGLNAHAFFYPPRNKDYESPPGEKPPLLVFTHGGPTGSTSSSFNPFIQFWTSRGFAIVDVNYGGSTGYGRAYRERLRGNWGVVDVDDAVNAARYLVEKGLVDGERLAIRGGSAGGYTTLSALAFRDVFKAGASLFGIGDLETFVGDTHKFESRYIDSLVGPYPEKKELYRERSAIYHLDRMNTPVILLQGLEDEIVPPNQSEMMFEALKEKGVPTAYIAFEGEQHGFRKAENIIRAIEVELYFYGKVFGFEPADEIEPVAIENL